MMTNQEYVKAFQSLKANLFNNHAIYHERITVLIQFTVFEIEEDRVKFRAKVIKPLNKEEAASNRMYQSMISQEEISFSVKYLWGMGDDDTNPVLKGSIVGRSYCSFILWLDYDLSKFVVENDDAITKKIPRYILWGQDWRAVENEQ